MNVMKRLYMEESENLHTEAQGEGRTLTDAELDKLSSEKATERFAQMIDDAKDRAKYE